MKPYPLKALLELRERERDVQVAELSKRLAETKARERRVAELQQEQRRVEEQAIRVRKTEQEHAAQVGLTVADLQLLGAHESGLREQAAELCRREDEARARLAAAMTATSGAQRQLAVSQARAQVVVKHRDRFEHSLLTQAERQAEEDALDVHTARAMGAARAKA